MRSRTASLIALILLLISGCGRNNSPVEITTPTDRLARWVDVKDDNSAPSSIRITPRIFPPNASTAIHFNLPVDANVSLRIYDGNGNVVIRLVDHLNLDAGLHAVVWNASNAASGVYLFELIYQGLGADLKPNTGIFVDSKKLLLVK